MGTINSYEFYQTCPSCGAVNNGSSACAYCGASLVKSQTTKDFGGMTPEEIFKDEDLYLQVKSGKMPGLSIFIVLFLIFFGAIFLIVSLNIGISFYSVGMLDLGVGAMLFMFMAIGVGSFAFLLLSAYRKIRCKCGNKVEGMVRGYQRTNFRINGKPTLAMKVRINTYPRSQMVIIKTQYTYPPVPVGMTVHLRNYKDYYIIEQ